MSDQQAIADILDRFRNRFFGKYRGTVTDIDEATMRIKAKVPAVLGTTKTGWCIACVPYAGPGGVGMAFLPEVGAGVWIEFEGGDVSYPVWVGCYWREGETPADAAPAVKVLATTQHKLLLDDDAPAVTLSDGNDNEIAMESSGLTVRRGDKKVEVTDAKVSVNDDALEVV